jgi:hypothetical protein
MSCRKALANRGFLVGGFITTAAIIVAFAILTTPAPAFAQSSLDSSSAPPADYAIPTPLEGSSLIEPATPGEATPSDATSCAAVPTKPSVAVKSVTAADNGSTSAAAHSGWDRVGDVYTDTDNEDQADKVLEVPPVLPPANPQPYDYADQTAQEGWSQSPDQVPTQDQVGSIEDYQDEEDGALMGAYGVPGLLGPVGINRFEASTFHSPLNPSFRPGFQRGFVPIVPRPFGGGMNSSILPTSPMFPSGSARFSGGMPFSRGMGFSGGMRGGPPLNGPRRFAMKSIVTWQA